MTILAPRPGTALAGDAPLDAALPAPPGPSVPVAAEAGAPARAAAPAPAAGVRAAVAGLTGGRAWRRLLHGLGRGVPAEPRACMYAGCWTTVGAGEGWRSGWLVFCSDECAADDQQDAVL